MFSMNEWMNEWITMIFFFLVLLQLWPKAGPLHILVLLSGITSLVLFALPLSSYFIRLKSYLFHGAKVHTLRAPLFGLCLEIRCMNKINGHAVQSSWSPLPQRRGTTRAVTNTPRVCLLCKHSQGCFISFVDGDVRIVSLFGFKTRPIMFCEQWSFLTDFIIT